MTTSNAQIKQKARELLQGHWSDHVTYSFLLIAVQLLCAGILNLFPDNGSWSATIVILAAASILQALLGLLITGASFHFLKCLRGEPSSVADAFVPYKKQPDRFLIVELIEIAAGIIAYIPMTAAAYLMKPSIFIYILVPVLFIAGSAAYIAVKATFALSRFLLLENDSLGAIASLKKSVAMMKGKKWRYVKLLLSFIGFSLLSLCSLGLGFIWVTPYFLTSQAEFYNNAISGE